MLQFFEPTEQLVAALFIGSCTLFAAILNAVAQLRVARDARRKSLPPPREAWKVRRWVVVGAGLALALGWSATTSHDPAQAADGSNGHAVTGLGVASLFARGGGGPDDALTVALLHLRQPLTSDEVVALLEDYDLRAYAIDLRLADESEAWVPVPAGLAPAVSMPSARLDAERRAWQEACAFESVLATAGAAHEAGEARDTVALRLVRARARTARSHAERLSAEDAVFHGLRVLASSSSASRVARDSAVTRAEIARYDPGWPVQAYSAPVTEGCEIVRMEDRQALAGSR